MDLKRAAAILGPKGIGAVSLEEQEEALRLAVNALEVCKRLTSIAVVTRCGDCRDWTADPETEKGRDGLRGVCGRTFEWTGPDDFCSKGKER